MGLIILMKVIRFYSSRVGHVLDRDLIMVLPRDQMKFLESALIEATEGPMQNHVVYEVTGSYYGTIFLEFHDHMVRWGKSVTINTDHGEPTTFDHPIYVNMAKDS